MFRRFSPSFLSIFLFFKLLPLRADDDSNDGSGYVKVKKEPQQQREERDDIKVKKEPQQRYYEDDSLEAHNARVPVLQKAVADSLDKLTEALGKDGFFLCRVSLSYSCCTIQLIAQLRIMLVDKSAQQKSR